MNGENRAKSVDQSGTADFHIELDAFERAVVAAEKTHHTTFREMLEPQRRKFSRRERAAMEFAQTLIVQRLGERQLS